MEMSDSHLAGITRLSSCTLIEWSATRERDPPHSLHTYRHPAPPGRSEGTARTLPGASTAETLYILRPAPWSGRHTHHPTHHRPMPGINNPPSHRSPTPPEEGQEHIRRATTPLSRSLFIERSERFPHCLLEIPLATPWPKQTLRLTNQNLLPSQLSSEFPLGFSLSIIPMCVL